MKREKLASGGHLLVQGFGKLRQNYQRWWLDKEKKYGSIIYGAIAMAVVILFGAVFYLLQGMVQFI